MNETPETTVLQCPKCDVPMRLLKAGTAMVDRCEQCYGIWIDKGEQQKIIRDKSMLAGLDIGPPATGRVQDAIRDITCPRCDQPMNHVKHPAQKHVGFELCPGCEGAFFDAGELEDLREFTLSERIRALFGG